MKKLTLPILTLLAGIAGISTSVHAATAIGLAVGGTSLINFDTDSPGRVSAPIPITGTGGATITAIDLRPSNRTIYGYGSNNQLYTISQSGVATPVANFTGVVDPVTPTPGTTPGAGSNTQSAFPPTQPVSLDINPAVGGNVGALRIVDGSNNNLRFTFTGSLLRDDTLTATNSMSVAFTPQILGVAYTNNDTDIATGTDLYYIDAATDSLYTAALPNDGALTFVGALGIAIAPGDTVGFDVGLNGTNNAVLSVNNAFYNLLLPPVAGGAFTAPTFIGLSAVGITDFTIIPEPGRGLLMLGGLSSLLFTRRRKR